MREKNGSVGILEKEFVRFGVKINLALRASDSFQNFLLQKS